MSWEISHSPKKNRKIGSNTGIFFSFFSKIDPISQAFGRWVVQRPCGPDSLVHSESSFPIQLWRLGIWCEPFASCSIGVPTSYQPCAELGTPTQCSVGCPGGNLDNFRWRLLDFFHFFETKEYNISGLMKAF